MGARQRRHWLESCSNSKAARTRKLLELESCSNSKAARTRKLLELESCSKHSSLRDPSTVLRRAYGLEEAGKRRGAKVQVAPVIVPSSWCGLLSAATEPSPSSRCQS